MVSSRVYPGLERHPGGPDNWVERAGGLPSYIERIAKHLHYERGYTISRAIASAVNTVKRWARMGKVAKYGDPHHKHVTAATAAKAAAAVAEWNAKRAAGKIHLTEAEFLLIDLTTIDDEFALLLAEDYLDDDGNVIDLADQAVEKSDTMVALMIPPKVAKKIAVDGGVSPEDLHMTLTFHGNTTPEQYQQICNDLTAWAVDGGPGELKGEIGGLGQFPDKGNGTPHFAPVDVPGVNSLHEQVKAVTSKTAPASEDHGYTPHMTLTMAKNGEAPPPPVPPTPVAFSSMHVVRGNTQRTEIPLGDTPRGRRGGARRPAHARLRSGDVKLSDGDMEIQDLAERANRIEDPALRAAARQKVLELAVPASKLTAEKRRAYAKSGAAKSDGSFPIFDRTSLQSAIRLAKTPEDRRHCMRRARSLGLTSMIPDNWSVSLTEMAMEGLLDLASTIAPRNAHGRVSDGRRSYKSQGRFKHGFIPVDTAAAEAKAKGSPIAMKRLRRLYGSAAGRAKSAPGAYLKSASGRAGQRSAGDRKINTKEVKITEGKEGSKASTGGVAFVNAPQAQASNRSAKKVGANFKEASKETRTPERARQNWDEIPANLKTVRNGQRYVVAEYADGQYITPWVGGVQGVEGGSLDQRKVYRSLSTATANNMTTAQLRNVINNPRTGVQAKKAARLVLRQKAKESSNA